MRSPVQVWSAAPLKNTTKTSCFFNAFLTHLRDLFLNRAWSLSSALGDWEYFVLSSPSLASSSSITTNEFRSRIFHFIFQWNEMKCTACSRAERSSPADGVSSCKQSPRFSLSSAAPLKNTPLRVCFFNVCKVFCTHLHNFFEIVRGACCLRSMPFLASNPSSSLAV